MTVLVGGAGPFVAVGDECILFSEFRATGVGSLTVDAIVESFLFASITGVGVLTATLNETSVMDLTTNGIGSLSATLAQTFAMAMNAQGVGIMTPTMAETYGMNATLTGKGVPTFETLQTYALMMSLLGVGTMTPTLQAFSQTMLATMRGQGILTVSSLAGDFVMDVTMTGAGTPHIELTGDWTMEMLVDAMGALRVALRKSADDVPATPTVASPTGGIWTIL